jgi:16S rRNA (cytosine1402-N4)-methyltransferase
MSHKPVLLREVLNLLNPQDNNIFLDCTFGAGGHSKALLESNKNCKVIALDRDIRVKPLADNLANTYPERFHFFCKKFSQIADFKEKFDGILMDIGVSSMQLDEAERGFSFMKKGPLTMTMGENDLSAYELVNNFSEKKIAEILIKGEEFQGKKIAQAICSARKFQPIINTKELADIITSVVKTRGKIHPATLTFQAIRIFVNQELEELAKALEVAPQLLKDNGKIALITFQGLEDIVVKQAFKKLTFQPKINKFKESQSAPFRNLTKKPIEAQRDEIKDNPRARSAKLRAIIKL